MSALSTMGLYIKVGADGNPEGFPMLGSNLIQILEVDSLTKEIIDKNGYVPFEWAQIQDGANLIVIPSEPEFLLFPDGVVRDVPKTREKTQQELINDFIRGPRSFLLAKTDWTQMSDVTIDAETKSKWAKYRQDLRELTDKFPNVTSANQVIWPDPPGPLDSGIREVPPEPMHPLNVAETANT